MPNCCCSLAGTESCKRCSNNMPSSARETPGLYPDGYLTFSNPYCRLPSQAGQTFTPQAPSPFDYEKIADLIVEKMKSSKS